MELRVKRRFKGEAYTIGSLYVDGVYFCDTLEDKVRDINNDGDLLDAGEQKVYGETAIPVGVFEVKMVRSPRFKRILPRLIDVPHFEGVLIHAGNDAGDSAGCILLGENKIKGKVVNSRVYENKLVALLQNETDIKITIE